MKNSIKALLSKFPLLKKLRRAFKNKSKKTANFSSKDYWERRYKSGGNSGAGSYNKFAKFKAEVINNFVESNDIKTIIEFGSGDGNQLKYFNFNNYLGFDVSENSIRQCDELFQHDSTKQFKLTRQYSGEKAELTLSLDVIYHLLEDKVFNEYMKNLFSASKKYVIIYSSNFNDQNYRSGFHVKHRKFRNWISMNMPDFKLLKKIPNKYPYNGNDESSSFADFYIFQRES
ncbi:hypothetical protein [Candidatus Ulvibacter alkanivorans]|uniref:hypothetical protein n=1 Tax=Candidatus Ulvibacter alkanivorans TaxID=2267620 RepID=UPI000DF481D3|nr:hypothetical protein [Candidatus Ulvibacter alkanivorans]